MSVPPLLSGLFDDAALFPPGNAPMAEAIASHARYRREWYADLVARFVCPAGRLAELDGALAAAEVSSPDTQPSGDSAHGDSAHGDSAPGDSAHGDSAHGDSAPEISLTVPGGLAELAPAFAVAEGLPRLRVTAVELPVAAAGLPAALDELGRTARRGVAVFAEIAVAEVTPELAAALRQAGLGLKLRTGGTAADAFPDAKSLAGAIEAAVEAGVRFKCTAGLHNALGHVDQATGWAHHGFLNVLLAVHAAQTGGAAADLLADRDGPALAEQARGLSGAEVAAVRAQFASIGSCSILEPLTDLTDLRLVSAA